MASRMTPDGTCEPERPDGQLDESWGCASSDPEKFPGVTTTQWHKRVATTTSQVKPGSASWDNKPGQAKGQQAQITVTWFEPAEQNTTTPAVSYIVFWDCVNWVCVVRLFASGFMEYLLRSFYIWKKEEETNQEKVPEILL